MATTITKRAITLTGDPIGEFKGSMIPAWYETDNGARYVFEHVVEAESPSDVQLEAGQSLLPPGLVYRKIKTD